MLIWGIAESLIVTDWSMLRPKSFLFGGSSFNYLCDGILGLGSSSLRGYFPKDREGLDYFYLLNEKYGESSYFFLPFGSSMVRNNPRPFVGSSFLLSLGSGAKLSPKL